jgi:hypothetical protein
MARRSISGNRGRGDEKRREWRGTKARIEEERGEREADGKQRRERREEEKESSSLLFLQHTREDWREDHSSVAPSPL